MKENKHTFFNYTKIILAFSRKRLSAIIAATILNAGLEMAGLALLIPFMSLIGMSSSSWLYDYLQQKLGGFSLQDGLLVIILLYVIVNVLQAAMQRFTITSMMKIRAGFSRHISDNIYQAFAEANWSYISSRRRSDVVHALTNDLRNIDIGTFFVLQLASSVPIIVAQIAAALIIAPIITLLLLIFGVALFFATRKNSRRMRDVMFQLHGSSQNSVAAISEHLAGIKEVKSYGAEVSHIEKFSKYNASVESKTIEFASILGFTNFFYRTSTIILIAAFFYVAMAIIKVEIVNLAMILIIFSRLWPLFTTVQQGWQFSLSMLPSWHNLQVWQEECRSASDKTTIELSPKISLSLTNEITIENLTFTYPNAKTPALDTVNLSIPVGQTIAITGLSGSGKSTLLDLLLGLIHPQQGKISVDNRHLDNSSLPSWRKLIGFVPQETFLFNGSIRENLLWAKPQATDEDIWQAIATAAADFVHNLPEGLDTVVGERGSRLSGGERQRLALARAFLRQPQLLILDEATSSLDVENERKIQSALRSQHGNMTIIMVAHRLSTIRSADKVVVLSEGKIAEHGSYTYLAKKQAGRLNELLSIGG